MEHAFLVLKRLWGFAEARYRGLAKNANRAFTALATVNLYMAAGQRARLIGLAAEMLRQGRTAAEVPKVLRAHEQAG